MKHAAAFVLLASRVAGDCSSAVDGSAVTAGSCDNTWDATQKWTVPTGATADTAGPIKLASNPKLCFEYHCTQKPCFKNGAYGPDAFLTECSAATTTFFRKGSAIVVAESHNAAQDVKGWCLDLRDNTVLQLYPCVGSGNQNFRTDASSHLIESATGMCASACTAPAPTPAPPGPFCASYHPVHAANVYDPSGPLLADDGTWHQWEDDG